MFITCMLWFILDYTSAPTIFTHGDWKYAVLDVLRPISSNINEEDEDEIAGRESTVSRNSSVSDRMIAQFFHEVEGPNRNWQE